MTVVGRGASRAPRTLIPVAVALIVAVIAGAAAVQWSTLGRGVERVRAGEDLLVAALEQDTALRGVLLTGDTSLVPDFEKAADEFDEAAAVVRADAGDRVLALLDNQIAEMAQWQVLAREEISRARAGQDPRRVALRNRSERFDEFAALNAQMQVALEQERSAAASRALVGSWTLVAGLVIGSGVVAYVFVVRSSRRDRDRVDAERGYASSQGEFAEALQVMRSEGEAFGLVRAHLERHLVGTSVTVLNRNNSDNRLLPTGEVADVELAGRLVDARPDSCLAVRTGRTRTRATGCVPLLACDLCDAGEGTLTCVPSLVGGEVTGTVLVRSGDDLTEDQRGRINESVGMAAPVLANLRSLALAESRASTDALTRLPNARACRDTLKQLVARADHTSSPLTAVMLDLDHFKQVNDVFGHGAGDDVLAAVGEVLRVQLRGDDFAGRNGGEEFLLLLPDTDGPGGLALAEKVRAAIAKIDVARVDRSITASLGVATYPRDARDADDLVRRADHALYVAKGAGRDRVEMVANRFEDVPPALTVAPSTSA